jgi:phospholipid/cholesterol/gamma-HCH transport system substrate-binding protein
MHLTKRVQRQLAFFVAITLIAGGVMAFKFLGLPTLLFGLGRYEVTVNLPAAAGLYASGNVTYRGTEVGRIEKVRLSPTGVDAVLSLDSSVKIPADLQAQVHSTNAIGEQFVELVPNSGDGPALKNGDVIPVDRTTVPADINSLLDTTNAGLQAIPHDDLKTAIDDAYTAVGGLGPELSRIVKGTTDLAIDARSNLDALTTVIDRSKPILDTQTDTADSIQAWASNLARITGSLARENTSVRGVLDSGPAAADEARQLLDRLQPSLPIVLANLTSLTNVAVVYRDNLEQLLVLVTPAIEALQGSGLANRDAPPAYRGAYLSFNLNVNLPPPCTTGYLPPQQVRSMSEVDYPERPAGDRYCRIPQDSMNNVRGVRNLPCETRPGKRAPTVEMCESDEQYVPLNDGFNWKGDPNATLSGQPVPQLPPGIAPPPAAPAPPPISAAQYDPATGTYTGPDGRQYTQANLAETANSPGTWQDLLEPPKGN